MGILKNILSFGDISRETGLSAVDKAHLRLAAAKAVLRLSRQWDQKIPADVFYMTLRVSQDDCPESRKLFLNKVHQYIKERLLDPKYACAFMLSIKDCQSPEYEECKHNLLEVVQICQQVKVRQLSVQADMNLLVAYPEYILAYLVHALAHDPSCPNVEDCQDLQAFEPTYWRLHLFLSAVLLGDEGLQPGGVSNSKQESFITIASIFQRMIYIKHERFDELKPLIPESFDQVSSNGKELIVISFEYKGDGPKTPPQCEVGIIKTKMNGSSPEMYCLVDQMDLDVKPSNGLVSSDSSTELPLYRDCHNPHSSSSSKHLVGKELAVARHLIVG